jgi:hypothetical protein
MRRNHIAVIGIVTTDTTAATPNVRQPPAVEGVDAVSVTATVLPDLPASGGWAGPRDYRGARSREVASPRASWWSPAWTSMPIVVLPS